MDERDIDLLHEAVDGRGPWWLQASGQLLAFEAYGPNGKDICVELDGTHKKTPAGLVAELSERAREFSVDEEMSLCVPFGVDGTPSAKECLEDLEFEADELAALAHLVGEAFADRSKKEER